jgi:phosphoribosylamine--glycine ligase
LRKVLIVGGGGREHAIAAKIRQDDPNLELVAAPGNPGIAELARCVPVGMSDIDGLLALAELEEFDLTVVGPEAPLAAGIADTFEARGHRIFGPTAAAARIESSKAFAKELMLKAGVPTGRASTHTNRDDARRALSKFGDRVVIKASGLAAGKGVIVAESHKDAEGAIDAMLTAGAFGSAGEEILIEEFLEGEELSLFGITDGTRVIPLIGAQDHKRLLDADMGPNTGGMGAYAPASLATPGLVDDVSERIFLPTLRALREAGSPFRGLLYAGLMLTQEGPKVIEFNCRFGDPETEAILPLMKSSLLDLLERIANGENVTSAHTPSWVPGAAVTTVIAATGYPDTPGKGDVITLPKVPAGVTVFHAGTALRGSELVSNGGRVLAVTGIGENIHAAAALSRQYAESVGLEGKQFRRDIGWRELERSANA